MPWTNTGQLPHGMSLLGLAAAIRDLRIAAPQERVVEGVRVVQVRREFEWADGTRNVLIEARLIGPQKSYTLMSSSPRLEWSTNNFEGFLPRIVDLVLLNNP